MKTPRSSKEGTLFYGAKTFNLPSQARDIFPGDDHILITDARGHLLRFKEESGGYLLDDLGSLGRYPEEVSYAAGNLAALEEDDGALSLLFISDVEKAEDITGALRHPAHLPFIGPGSCSLQATAVGAYIYDEKNREISSLLWDLPSKTGGQPVRSEEEESVFAFSPSPDGALYFQKYGDGPIRPRYIDSEGEFHLLSGDWQEEYFVGNSIAHARDGDKVYFTYQVNDKKGGWIYPLYLSKLSKVRHEPVAYLKDRVRKLQPFADSLLVFYENGELDILEKEKLMKSERLPQGNSHMMLNKSLLFLPERDYRKTLALQELNEAESARQGLRLGL